MQVPSIHQDSKAILLNKGVLAINDDPLGRMPFRYSIDSLTGIELWRKELVGGDVRRPMDAFEVLCLNLPDRTRLSAAGLMSIYTVA